MTFAQRLNSNGLGQLLSSGLMAHRHQRFFCLSEVMAIFIERRNIKNLLMRLTDQLLTRKRSVARTVID